MKQNFFLYLFFGYCTSWAQLPTNTWRTHFDYAQAFDIEVVNGSIFCSTINGFFSYNPQNKMYKTYSKLNGLTDNGISAFTYYNIDNQLFVGYNNGNIDRLTLDQNNSITATSSIGFIKNSDAILSSKKINQLILHNNTLFFAADFGVGIIDIHQNEIKEIYQKIGEDGKQIVAKALSFRNDSIFIKTERDIRGASLLPTVNLYYFKNWKTINDKTLFQTPTLPNGIISPAPKEIVYSDANTFWIADTQQGLLSNAEGAIAHFQPEGLNETKGYLRNESGNVQFIGNQVWEFHENKWIVQNNPIPNNINYLTDFYSNEWSIQGSVLVVTKNNETYFYTTNDNLSGNPKSIALDAEGQLWVGTTNGVSVIQTTADIVQNPVQAYSPIFGNQRLLLQQNVSAIVIDAGQRKWFGTNNGLYFLNKSVDKLNAYFTSENAPFSSNNIQTMQINQSGELFLQTTDGVFSYQTDATPPKEDFSNVEIYPNPVRPEFDGVLTINGLVEDAYIKITSVSGIEVATLTSNGGSVSWDLQRRNGDKVPTGIYFIFMISPDLKEHFVGKLAVVK